MFQEGSIEIAEGTLYSVNSRIIDFGDGEYVLIREALEWVPGNEDSYHTVKDGDRLELLAQNFYKGYTENAHRYWWVIADANNIENPLDLTGLLGTNIIIPNILNVKLKIRQMQNL